MKIKSIQFEDHPILANLYLDFTNENGEAQDTIILAGENGCGKSTILNTIYDFSTFKHDASLNSEKRIFTVVFNDNELSILKSHESIGKLIKTDMIPLEFIFSFKFPWTSWTNIVTTCKLTNGDNINIASQHFHYATIRPLFGAIFSDVEINFNHDTIKNTTSIELDEKILTSKKTSNKLATEITQMLIDIQSSDANDYFQYAQENIGSKIDGKHLELRTSRFKNAFSYMFKSKKYKGVKNINGTKSIIFEDNGVEIPINNLSSGEKQIIFRGSFLLKDQKTNIGSFVLIDEPEISLHPKWQLKIIDYYKRLFLDSNSNQNSQIFFVTHSPFIIHNNNRYNDKVIILKKEDNVISTPENQEFFKWSPSELINQAFNVDIYKENQKALIITEGKTDWKHIKNAFTKLKDEFYQDLEFEFLEYEDDKLINGDSGLQKICEHVSKIPKEQPVICIFDRDITNTVRDMHDDTVGYKIWNNNTYSFCIPIPAFRNSHKYVTIESYYQDNEIKTIDNNGRRLFLTSEFKEKSGKHKEDSNLNFTTIGYLKNNTDELNAKIIDSHVYDENDNNTALSKSDFSNNILNGIESFSEFNLEEFKSIFEIIKQILNKQG